MNHQRQHILKCCTIVMIGRWHHLQHFSLYPAGAVFTSPNSTVNGNMRGSVITSARHGICNWNKGEIGYNIWTGHLELSQCQTHVQWSNRSSITNDARSKESPPMILLLMAGFMASRLVEMLPNLAEQLMSSMKLVILLHSLYWSIHTKDESFLTFNNSRSVWKVELFCHMCNCLWILP